MLESGEHILGTWHHTLGNRHESRQARPRWGGFVQIGVQIGLGGGFGKRPFSAALGVKYGCANARLDVVCAAKSAAGQSTVGATTRAAIESSIFGKHQRNSS